MNDKKPRYTGKKQQTQDSYTYEPEFQRCPSCKTRQVEVLILRDKERVRYRVGGCLCGYVIFKKLGKELK